jgi:hypothetical protein
MSHDGHMVKIPSSVAVPSLAFPRNLDRILDKLDFAAIRPMSYLDMRSSWPVLDALVTTPVNNPDQEA